MGGSMGTSGRKWVRGRQRKRRGGWEVHCHVLLDRILIYGLALFVVCDCVCVCACVWCACMCVLVEDNFCMSACKPAVGHT